MANQELEAVKSYFGVLHVRIKEIMEERKMARKEEIKDYLEHSGFEKSDMKEYWKLLAEEDVRLPRVVTIDLDDEYESESNSCAELKADGVKWKMLPMDIITMLPELAEPYLHTVDQTPTPPSMHMYVDIENIPAPEDLESQQITQHIETIDDQDLDDFEAMVIRKLDNGQRLSESELRTLAYEYADESKREYGDNRRWSRSVCDIIEIGNRYYSLSWSEGLTEMQPDMFFDQPERVYPSKSMHLIEKVRFIPDREAANECSYINEVEQLLEDSGYTITDDGEIER